MKFGHAMFSSTHKAQAILGRAVNSEPSTAVRPSVLGLPTLDLRQGLRGQFSDDLPQQGRVEDAAGFAQRTEGGPFAAQEFLDLGQAAGLLDVSQTIDEGAEQGQQEKAGVLVEMELAVAGLIAWGGVGVETVQPRPQDLEVLEAAQVLVAEFLAAGCAILPYPGRWPDERPVVVQANSRMRKNHAERKCKIAEL